MCETARYFVKSNKQRRAELTAKRKGRAEKEAAAKRRGELARRTARGTVVDTSKLAPDNSYSVTDFVLRGYYEDMPFTCKECGKEEVWTATRQKW